MVLPSCPVLSFWDTGSGIWIFCSLLSEPWWNGKRWTLKILFNNCGTDFLVSHCKNTCGFFQNVCVLMLAFFYAHICTQISANLVRLKHPGLNLQRFFLYLRKSAPIIKYMCFISDPVLSCFSLLLEMKEEKSSMFSGKLSKIRDLFLSSKENVHFHDRGLRGFFGCTLNH